MPKPGLLTIKYFIAVLLLLVCALSANAQDYSRPRISFGIDPISFGVGPYGEDYPYGILGLTGKFELPVNKSPLNFTGSIRVPLYFPSDKPKNYAKPILIIFVPVQVGIRYYLERLYIEGEGGVSFSPPDGGGVETYTAKAIAPQLSAGIGYGFRFDKAEKFGLDISLRYDNRIEATNPAHNYGSFNYIAINAAFSLGL